MNKMEDVKPETFLQGLGCGEKKTNLGWLGATDEEMLMGLSGVGQLAMRPPPGRPVSMMDAIIGNAREMNAKMALVARARQVAASKSPILAVELAKKKEETSMPGANEAKGVKEALNAAAKKAAAAKKDEQAARVLLAQSDKRGAAAKAVNALTKAREAATLANRAEKTRLTRSLDILANTLKAQADYIDSMVQTQVQHSGANARTMALSATAQSLREQVKRLQAQSAAVASMPDVPAGAPSQQRIADLANKFNIRTAAEQKFDNRRALVSVLGDLAENPLAQVKDYAGAYSYYGQDAAGKMMTDMEFGNNTAAMKGLAGFVHGIGYVDAGPILAQADRTVAAAQRLSQQAYAGAVQQAAGLGGLGRMGALGGEWEDWCDKNVPSGATDAAKDYKGDVAMCKAQPNPVAAFQAPWTAVGRTARGAQIDWWKTAQEVPKAIAQAGQKAQQVQQAAAAPVPAAPPAPSYVPQAFQPAYQQAYQYGQQAYKAASGVPMYVYALGGVAVLGAAYFIWMKPKAVAA